MSKSEEPIEMGARRAQWSPGGLAGCTRIFVHTRAVVARVVVMHERQSDSGQRHTCVRRGASVVERS